MSSRRTTLTPIGTTAADARRRRAESNPAYRAHEAERAPFREIAWLLIKYRMDKGLTQQELADIVGTSHSQISRIESGRHKTNFDTLARMAHALDVKMLIGFEATTAAGRPKRDLVTI